MRQITNVSPHFRFCSMPARSVRVSVNVVSHVPSDTSWRVLMLCTASARLSRAERQHQMPRSQRGKATSTPQWHEHRHHTHTYILHITYTHAETRRHTQTHADTHSDRLIILNFTPLLFFSFFPKKF